MLTMLTSTAALAMLLAAGHAAAAEYEIANHADLVFAEHDGVKLVGDLYLPKGRAKAPVLVAVHGGGWQVGSRAAYRYWGLFLARNGYALFAIDYRLAKAGVFPAAVYDTKAAIQFVRAKAGEYNLDADRIGLIGDLLARIYPRLSRLRAISSIPPTATMPTLPFPPRSKWSWAFTASTTCTPNGCTI